MMMMTMMLWSVYQLVLMALNQLHLGLAGIKGLDQRHAQNMLSISENMETFTICIPLKTLIGEQIFTISVSRSACLNFDVPLSPRFSKHKPLMAYDSAKILRLRLKTEEFSFQSNSRDTRKCNS